MPKARSNLGKEVAESQDPELAAATTGLEKNVPHLVEQFEKSVTFPDPQHNPETRNITKGSGNS